MWFNGNYDDYVFRQRQGDMQQGAEVAVKLMVKIIYIFY